MKLILDNVRSFVGRHEIPIKPLTLLVGENSSGKSTLLACLHAACQYPDFPFRTQWNARPYQLGTFDTIATRKQGQATSGTFGVGIEDLELNESEIFAVFHKVSDRIVPATVRMRFRRATLDLGVRVDGQIPPSTTSAAVTWDGEGLPLERDWPYPLFGFDPIWSVIESLRSAIPDEQASANKTAHAVADLREFWELRQVKRPNAISLGPRRTDPQRTYSVENLAEDEQGNDYPAILIQHHEKQFPHGSVTRAGLLKAISEFGKESGLFSRLDVRRVGTGGSRSIRIKAVVGTKHYDLTDVGYGISQILPVLVKCFATVSTSAILVQQPEVHLHPHAQAAFASFLTRWIVPKSPSADAMSIVLETHSDFILDRIRIEVAKQHIAPESVGILFLYKDADRTTVYPLELDECGNITNAPPSYRQFFLREELNLLTRTKR